MHCRRLLFASCLAALLAAAMAATLQSAPRAGQQYTVPRPTPGAGAYSPACDADPLASVEEFDWRLLPPEKDVTDFVTDACLGEATKVYTQIERTATDVLTHFGALPAQPGQPQPGDWTLAKDGAMLLGAMQELVAKMTEVTAGIDVYVLKCVADGVIDHQLGTGATAGRRVKAVAEDYAATRQEVLAEYEGLSRDFRRGNEVDWNQKAHAFQKKLPDIGKRVGSASKYFLAVQQAWKRILEYADHPEQLLPTYGLEAGVISARIDDRLSRLGDDCRLQEADADLRAGTERIKSGLASARLVAARWKRLERRFGSFVEQRYPPYRSLDPARNPTVYFPIKTEWDNWARAYNEFVAADRAARELEPEVRRLGEQCERLKRAAIEINARAVAYSGMVREADRALRACDLARADDLIRQLVAAGSGGCSAFLTEMEPAGPGEAPRPVVVRLVQEYGLRTSRPRPEGCADALPTGTTPGPGRPSPSGRPVWVRQPVTVNAPNSELSIGEGSFSYSYAKGPWGPMSNTLKWSAPPATIEEGQTLTLDLSVAHAAEWKPTRYGFEAGSISGWWNVRCFATPGDASGGGSRTWGTVIMADSGVPDRNSVNKTIVFAPRGATGEQGDECFLQISGGAPCSDHCPQYGAVITWQYKRQGASR